MFISVTHKDPLEHDYFAVGETVLGKFCRSNSSLISIKFILQWIL